MSSAIERRYLRSARRNSNPSFTTFPSHKELDTNFQGIVRRSFTPVRELSRSASTTYLPDYDAKLRYRPFFSTSSIRENSRSPAYFDSLRIEDQPLRKYDLFSIRSWSYPIWRYLHRPQQSRFTPTVYAPPTMATQYVEPITRRRAYSGHAYLAGEHSFYLAEASKSAYMNRYYHSGPSRSPWYRDYYGQSSLRHFGGYRPRPSHYFSRPSWMR